MTAGWERERARLVAHGVELAPGLREGELARVEDVIGARVPPDLRAMLATFLPVGPRLPDWREPESASIAAQLAWPLEGMRFDLEHASFWLASWGPRPASLDERIAIATQAVAAAPRLVPVFAHRYLPAEPCETGNPVLSIHQTDVIVYGHDLRAYVTNEWCDSIVDRDGAMASAPAPRTIRFWSELLEPG